MPPATPVSPPVLPKQPKAHFLWHATQGAPFVVSAAKATRLKANGERVTTVYGPIPPPVRDPEGDDV